MKRIYSIMAGAVLSIGLSSPGLAHTKLVSAQPGPNSTIASSQSLRLVFSGKLMPKLTRVNLFMVGMGGRAHAPMKVEGGKTSFTPDGKTVLVKFARPLAAGAYRLDYQGLAADTHKTQGSYTFHVK